MKRAAFIWLRKWGDRMFKVYCRLYQGVFRLTSRFLPWQEPELLIGEQALQELPKLLRKAQIESVLIITDQGIRHIGLMDDFLEDLHEEGITYTIYDKTVPNPTIDNIEEALTLYKEKDCQGLVAFGGGSSMDCAKGVGARLARPDRSIPQLRGILKIGKPTPPLIAVPTTAGTGSEATLAAVITDSKTHEKYAVNDHVLIPDYAVLDPLLTLKLPASITATTGMDALTHAIEAFIGKSNTPKTSQASKEAVTLIFDNLYEAYSNGSNIKARTTMQRAAYLAGVAFTRAYVGNVHAIAHQLGGFYSIPHGLANAVLLPYVLEYYGSAVYQPLAELSDLVGLVSTTESNQTKAKRFIKEIQSLNERMSIPTKIEGIQDQDLPTMVDRAYKEANPLYPVPKIFSKKDFKHLFQMIQA